MKPWELLEPDVDLGIKIGLRRVITRLGTLRAARHGGCLGN